MIRFAPNRHITDANRNQLPLKGQPQVEVLSPLWFQQSDCIYALNWHIQSVIGSLADRRGCWRWWVLPPPRTGDTKACSSLAERCLNMAEEGVRFLPRLPKSRSRHAARYQIVSFRLLPPPAMSRRGSVYSEVDVIENRFDKAICNNAGVSTEHTASGAGPKRLRLRTRALGTLGVVIVLAGCGSGGPFGTHSDPPVVEKSAAKEPDDYVIGSGDSLSVFVYRNPDLSEPAVAVRPDGRISTPLIEDIVASGKTPTQLAREIEQRLTKYIQEPNVTVIVRGFIGPPDRQVRVIGEATDPIAIPYRDHMTLLDVMIATHGITKYAAGNRAVIVRLDPHGKQQTIRVHLNDLIKSGDIAQNIEMNPGDTLLVPQSWF
jgi:polysaccharide biosynthesis/export protein